MTKMLVTDYDKTFYINDSDIIKNIKSIQQFINEKNIFTIATGRSYQDLKIVQKKYNFKYNYAIINHGATIIDDKDNILSNIPIDKNIIFSIRKDLMLEKSVLAFYCNKLESRSEFKEGLTKINIRYQDEQTAIEITNLINKKYNNYVNAYHISTYSVEIISNTTGKKEAIKYLQKLLNLNIKDIYTIGDSYSDIEMIKEFNGSIMKESIQELKELNKKEYESVSDLVNDIKNK